MKSKVLEKTTNHYYSTHHRRTQGTHQAISTAEFSPWIQQKVRSWKAHLQWQMYMLGHYTIVQPQKPTVVMQTVKWKTHSDRQHFKLLCKCISKFILAPGKGIGSLYHLVKVSISECKGKHKERTEQDNEPSNNRLSAESLFLLFTMFRWENGMRKLPVENFIFKLKRKKKYEAPGTVIVQWKFMGSWEENLRFIEYSLALWTICCKATTIYCLCL